MKSERAENMIALLWSIWIQRNEIIFNNGRCNPGIIISAAVEDLKRYKRDKRWVLQGQDKFRREGCTNEKQIDLFCVVGNQAGQDSCIS